LKNNQSLEKCDFFVRNLQ